jgi:glycosyltransferase involved in cell wall biosynthesis
MLETPLFGILAKLFRKGLVITHHGDLVLPVGGLNKFIVWVTFQLYKFGARFAQHLIAYSQDYADHSYYIEPFHAKASPVYPPIVVPQPEPTQTEVLRSMWLEGTNGSARLIGYAGRFVEEKRPDVLINALETIHKKYPGSRIVFAGEYDISYENFYGRHTKLVEKYRDSLVFLGLLNDAQDVANFYAACDVLALPSDTECFALVQVEAMRCGTPVVCTNIPGAREVVRVTGMGELVPPGDPAAFGEGVVKVLDQRDAYVKPLSQIDAIFNLDQTVNQYEELLYSATNTARAPR